MIFDLALWRFAVSGTLILLFGVADRLGRRAAPDPLRHAVRPSRLLGLVAFTSVLAFYLTIRPWGHPIAGGWGNLAGIGLALAAAALRLTAARSLRGVRMPDVATRMLFYVALPIAVGSWPGLLVLTLPALAASVLACRAEDERLLARHGEAWRERMLRTWRLVPGVW